MNGPRLRRAPPDRGRVDREGMRGYGQYCPIALAAEVFAQRWTPIIIRNLHLGCAHFGDILDGATGLPRSVLSQRLRALERDGVVTRTTSGHATEYALTEMGAELSEICMALGAWGARWREVQPADQNPYLVLWTLSRVIDPESLPRARVVVRFDLRPSRPAAPVLAPAAPHGQRGLHGGARLPRRRGGDHRRRARSSAGTPVGSVIGTAQEAGGMTVAAPPWLERELARWGRLSPFADIEPRRSQHAVS